MLSFSGWNGVCHMGAEEVVADALADGETLYIGSLTTAAGARALEAFADRESPHLTGRSRSSVILWRTVAHDRSPKAAASMRINAIPFRVWSCLSRALVSIDLGPG